MYRNKRKNKNNNIISLDALMDILTCTVGIMIFVVVFTLLEAGGAVFEMNLPMLKDPPKHQKRELMVCSDGQIMPLSLNKAYDNSFGKIRENMDITYNSLPEAIRKANNLKYEDDFFKYTFNYHEYRESYWRKYRFLYMTVNKKRDAPGEEIKSLNSAKSKFIEHISSFNNDSTWVAFFVDNESIEVYKKARKILKDNGFNVGWDPIEQDFFPLNVSYAGGGGSGIIGKGID